MGTWQTYPISYLRPNRLHCAFCGQPIPVRLWKAEVDGRAYGFCSPDHERRFQNYWLPRHGKAIGGVDGLPDRPRTGPV